VAGYVTRPRDVAQPGSAPEWGSGGRRFESGRPDLVSDEIISTCRCARGVDPSGASRWVPTRHPLGRLVSREFSSAGKNRNATNALPFGPSMARAKTPLPLETEVLVRSRRWCALCFGLSLELGPKTQGQIAHVDRTPTNTALDNLCLLCLPHHDLYDSKPSQSKGFTPAELRTHREELYSFLTEQRTRLASPGLAPLSTDAWAVAELLSSRSQLGRRLDSQVRLEALPALTRLTEDDVDIAVDELRAAGLVDLNGTRDSSCHESPFLGDGPNLHGLRSSSRCCGDRTSIGSEQLGSSGVAGVGGSTWLGTAATESKFELPMRGRLRDGGSWNRLTVLDEHALWRPVYQEICSRP
jgi:hypothetical protein